MHTNFEQNSPTCLPGGQTINPALNKVTRHTEGMATMITNTSSLSTAKRMFRKSTSEKGGLHRISGNALSRLLLAASLAWMLSPADAQQPQQAWQPYGTIMRSLQQANGAMIDNTFDTSSELLTSNMTLTVYKAPGELGGYDYYLVAGPFSHAVTPATNNGNGFGWKSFQSGQSLGFGWCGANMNLNVTGDTADGLTPTAVYLSAPESVGDLSSQTTNLTLGVGTQGLSASYDYVKTWDDPDVAIWTYNTATGSGNQAVNNIMNYSAGLATCSLGNFRSGPDTVPGAWAPIPDPPSKFGTALQISIIYQVKQGRGLQINWNNDVWWHFFYEPREGTPTQVNQNLYGVGAFVADFGAAPVYNTPNGTVSANGPQIVDAYGYCLTAQIDTLVDSPVYRKACNPMHADATQNWYYTAYSQIVNVATGTCLDIQGGFSQGGTPVAGRPLMTTACAPALPTSACTANGTCATTGTAVSQQWQLTSSPSVTGSTATNNNSLFLMSSSGYAVNANPSASPLSDTYTIQPASSGTCFVLPFDNTTTPVSGSCSLTPAQ